MAIDEFGVTYLTTDDLVDILYRNPDVDISHIPVLDPEQFNSAVKLLFPDFGPLKKYKKHEGSVEEFDKNNQSNWFMPKEYQEFDIVQWVLDQCSCETELQRCGEELLLYHERNLIPLLKYLKYLVDTLRKNNIVWGVGRGSSVSSYVLYLIGVHKINSIYYELDIHEFLR